MSSKSASGLNKRHWYRMEQVMYNALEQAEESWWYRGRTAAVQSALQRFSIPHGKVLDLGAGFGAMYPLLKSYGPVSAYEIDEACLAACMRRGYASVVASEEELFFSPVSYTVVGAFDVLEHLADDYGFLRKLYKRLNADSYIIATVPAHPLLWSQHDTENRHYRRYTKKTVRALLMQTGFDPVYIGYWNSLLFIAAVLLRLVGRAGAGALNPPSFVDWVLRTVVLGEAWIARRVSMPIGLGLVVIARRRL